MLLALVTMRWLARAVFVLAVAVVGTLAVSAAAPPAAQAHPFGPPQTLDVQRRGDDVLLRWRFGANDDIAYLAVALGALPEDRMTLDGATFYEEGDDDALADSPDFEAYLLDHISVRDGRTSCRGEVVAADDLSTDGVQLAYRCPRPSAEVAVSVDMLTDLHPAYRTLATGPSGQRAVYSVNEPAHVWTLPVGASSRPEAGSGSGSGSRSGSGLGRSAGVQLGTVAAAVVVPAGVLVWVRRRRGWQRVSPADR